MLLILAGSIIHQDDTNIHNVGPGQTGPNQAANFLKEMVGIVGIQVLFGVQRVSFSCSPNLGIDASTGRVGRPVFAVGAATENGRSRNTVEWKFQSERECHFLITTAQAFF